MGLLDRRFSEKKATIESLKSYASGQGISARPVNENTIQFEASAEGLQSMNPSTIGINVTDQGDGRFSTAAAIFPLPKEDTPESSAIMRAALEARGSLQSGPGLFSEGDIVAIGSETAGLSPRELLHGVDEVARTAIPVMKAVYAKAVEIHYRLDELPRNLGGTPD